MVFDINPESLRERGAYYSSIVGGILSGDFAQAAIGRRVAEQISLIGYGLAAAAYATVVVLMATLWRARMKGSVLPFACAAGFVWAALLAAISQRAGVSGLHIYLVEFFHDFVWLLFLSMLLSGSVGSGAHWLLRWGGVALCGLLLFAGLLAGFSPLRAGTAAILGQALVLGSIATSLYALVGVEQIYRNSRPGQQNALKLLCLGIAGIFVYDLILYSNAVVTGGLSALFWEVRGFVAALCVPLIALAVKRLPNWNQGIFVSRQVVTYTTTLFAAGLYLTAVGFAGYYIQRFGYQWGAALQVVFFAAALIGFVLILLSDQLRARFGVFVAKHFFERRYDYRAEWLRLIATLTANDDGLPLKKRAVKALAQIVGSKLGLLWQAAEDGRSFETTAGWNVSVSTDNIEANSPFVEFLEASGWILDLRELEEHPERYQELNVDDIPQSIRRHGYVIPLQHNGLTGFVVLGRCKPWRALNFEDHDLLKTAGRQIASYLAQEIATEKLAESRQFEAYSRFTAFVMHDLKNAIAQQSLVVKNAEKHKRNPEFVDDAIDTIRGSVERMSRVLAHLKQRAVDDQRKRVDLGKLLLQAASQCSDRRPVPAASVPDRAVQVLASHDRLHTAICHALRNAQDACEPDDSISLQLEIDGRDAVVRIADTGRGMQEEFMRERLFRPFDSTKGAEGMGIGAYQIRETVRDIGGSVDVDSSPGEGTCFTLRIPRAAEANG